MSKVVTNETSPTVVAFGAICNHRSIRKQFLLTLLDIGLILSIRALKRNPVISVELYVLGPYKRSP